MPRKVALSGPMKDLQTRVPADIYEKLNALAQSRLMSRSAIIREALLAYTKKLKRSTG